MPSPFRSPFSIVVFTLLPFLLNAQPSNERFANRSRQAEERGLAEPFKGVTTDGKIIPDLYKIKQTGVSTKPARLAAEAFLQALTPKQRAKTVFAIDDDEWRKWMNQHFYVRQGVSFEEMDDTQRAAAFKLLEDSLSAKGLQLSQDIMKLNRTLGELKNNDFAQYNEWLYNITVMGDPSATEPWGWQIDGHHLIINYFVLGDQVVMSPVFIGSEPVTAETGKYAGTAILQEELAEGLAMMLALTPEQQAQATISSSKTSNNNLAEAFKDNAIINYAGIKASQFSQSQRAQFFDLIQLFINNMKAGHAEIRMEEIEAHLDETHFAWIGKAETESPYYFRIQSPVILIEFDQQRPVGLRHIYPAREPTPEHIHVVIRTPNGNDYGKDLLRQHYESHPHPH